MSDFFIKEKSVTVEYEDHGETKIEGIGLVKSDNTTGVAFYCMEDTLELKNKLGNSNFAKLYNLVKPLQNSDLDGVPRHCDSNGYYYISHIKGLDGAKNDGSISNLDVAKHFRLSLNDTDALIKNVNSKEDLQEFTKIFKHLWKDEAKKALVFIDSIQSDLSNKNKIQNIKP